ncbi:LPXTG cell wall anchor domain-containing protein [Enterococcus rivorum]|nr:LPXTG cell wall anchor domain-containing protein [Enterococcus rivorum]MBP2099889.1 LPXTG-motif cell wall-anchored protein [Enterococcus rivorum]
MKRFCRIFFIFLLVYFSFEAVSVVEAVDGGQVNIRVGITFEESSQSKDSSSSSISSTESVTSEASSATHSQDKPRGKLPKAGENGNNYLFLGIALLLLSLSVVIFKSIRGKQE